MNADTRGTCKRNLCSVHEKTGGMADGWDSD